jgi:drug/metabolite transporter (DMT)-like permease
MTRVGKIRWIGWTLPILGGVIIFADLQSGQIEKSMFWTVFALILGAFGLGVYIWTITTPGERRFPFDARKHPIVANVAFFAAILALVVLLIRSFFFATRSSSQYTWSPLSMTVCLGTYYLLVVFIRHVRSRRLKSTKS